MTPRRRNRNADGFTLMEVMAALAVFLIGIVSVLALLAAGTRLHADSQEQVVSTDVGEELLLLAEREVAERAPFLNGAALEPGPSRPVPSRPELQYSWKVIGQGEDGPFLLVVEVTGLSSGKSRKQIFERVLPRLLTVEAEVKALGARRKS